MVVLCFLLFAGGFAMLAAEGFCYALYAMGFGEGRRGYLLLIIQIENKATSSPNKSI